MAYFVIEHSGWSGNLKSIAGYDIQYNAWHKPVLIGGQPLEYSRLSGKLQSIAGYPIQYNKWHKPILIDGHPIEYGKWSGRLESIAEYQIQYNRWHSRIDWLGLLRFEYSRMGVKPKGVYTPQYQQELMALDILVIFFTLYRFELDKKKKRLND